MSATGLAARLAGLTPAPESPAARPRVRLLEAPPRQACRSLTRTVREPAGRSVASRQWVRLPVACPEGEKAARLLRALDRAYLSWIERTTAGTVGVTVSPDGGARAAIVPFGPTGLVLAPPVLELGGPAATPGARDPRGGSILRPILEGCLVARTGGRIGVLLQPSALGPFETLVAVDLLGFWPLLRELGWPGRLVYRRTQARVHERLSRSYLRHTAAPLVLAAAR